MLKMLVCTKLGSPHQKKLIDAVASTGITPVYIDVCKPDDLFALEVSALLHSDMVVVARPEESHHHALLAYASGLGKRTFLFHAGLSIKEDWMSFADFQCATMKECAAVLEAVLL